MSKPPSAAASLSVHPIGQAALCLGVVTLAIFTFGFVITAMTREAQPETGQSVAHMAAVDGGVWV